MPQNYGLGRGLASLIPQKKQNFQPAADRKIDELKSDYNYFGKISGTKSENQAAIDPKKNIQEIEVSRIVPNPHQPRIGFDDEKLKELAESIKHHGIIQPLIVTKKGNDFELIAGERRFQAAKLIGLAKVPVIVREADEKEKLELAIVENVQRHDLNPVEEARAYRKLMDEYQMHQDEVAAKVGKSRSAVANKIRLLNLPIEIQRSLIAGKISEGHAKAILAISNPEKQRALYELILKENLTVRQTEEKTQEISVRSHKRTVTSKENPAIREWENRLMGVFGTKVKITRFGDKGRIIIDYYSSDDLDNILNKIG